MKKRIITVALLAFFMGSLLAKELSVGIAALSSAVLPGMGQLYADNNKKAAFFLSTEALLIFSLLKFNHEKNTAISNYEFYAYENAGLTKGSSDSIYNLAQKFQSSEEYNRNQEMIARNVFLIYEYSPEDYSEYLLANTIPEEHSWNWNNQKEREKFVKLRRDKQDLEIYAKFSLAAMLINRVVSVVDASLSAKRQNKLNRTTFSAAPTLNHPGFKIDFEYRF
ncbi:MAG: hypothetical protein PHR06_09305 [Candidatus Cloacimonetes bacterium]|nr:hypothetical protein [Candidatus Cloacimonadota bacterium]